MQYVPSTTSRQLKFGKTLQVSFDVKVLGRPKEFSSKEEDFQQWSKKTEAFFAGVIKEPEMMLEWSAEQATEITTTANDLEFHAVCDDCGRRSLQVGVRAAADAHSTYGSHEL